MNFLSHINGLESSEIRQWVKENKDNPEFLEALVLQKEELVPKLLSHKAFSEELSQHLVQNNHLLWLLKEMMNANFVPDLAIVEQTFNLSEDSDLLVLDFLKTFPTLALTGAHVVTLINHELLAAAAFVLNSKPALRTSSLLVFFLKRKYNHRELFESLKDDKSLMDFISEDIGENLDGYSPELLDVILPYLEISKYSFSLFEDYLEQHNLSARTLEYIFDNTQITKVAPFLNIRTNNWIIGHFIRWTNELEKIEKISFKILVNNPPPSSKHYKRWIQINPEVATFEELLTLSADANVIECVLKYDIEKLKTIDLSALIEDRIGPMEVAKMVKNDKEKCIYLFENLSSKYRAAFRKVWPKDYISEEKNSRKRSYFFEMFSALKEKNIEEMRSLASKYSFETFIADARQSSKSNSCEQTSIDETLLFQMTKEELFLFLGSNFRMYSSNEEQANFYFTWTEQEALEVYKRLGFKLAIKFCENPAALITNKEIKDEDLSYYLSEHAEAVIAQSEVFKALIKRCKKDALELSAESVKALAKEMNAAEIRSILAFESYSFKDLILIKAKDGEYVVTLDSIKEMLVHDNVLESQDFLSSMKVRDESFLNQLITAYLKGNKALTALAGRDVKIRRSYIEEYETLQKEMEVGDEGLVEQIFEAGGKLEDFEKVLTDAFRSLNRYHKQRVINVGSVSLHSLAKLAEHPNLKFKIETLEVNGSDFEEDAVLTYPNLDIKSVEIDYERVYGDDEEKLSQSQSNLFTFINKHPEIEVKFEIKSAYGDSFYKALQLVKKGVSSRQIDSSIDSFIHEAVLDNNLLSALTPEDLEFLTFKGLQVDSRLINGLLESNDNPEVLKWLHNRVGDLSQYVYSEEWASYNEEDNLIYQKELQKYGVSVLSEEQFSLRKIRAQIETEGKEFNEIEVSSLSANAKLELIKFIESKDSRYSQLKLTSMKLEDLSTISSFDSMKAQYSLDNEFLVSLFNVPQSLVGNKKFMQSLKDLLSVEGVGVAQNINLLKAALQSLQPGLNINLNEVVNYQDVNKVLLTEFFESLKPDVLLVIKNYKTGFQYHTPILENQDRNGVLRFIRSCMARDERYVQDSFEMINNLLAGLKLQEERLVQWKQEEVEAERILQVQETVNSIQNRLAEVVVMDHIEHIHDRIVPLLSFLKQDPARPLGQDKFKKLENPKNTAETKVTLFFPKTISDLSYLGDNNGWCVNRHSGYAEGVINKGNILVGLCPEGESSTKENVIALAHFIKTNTGFDLEQLRWSNRIKNGNNVDATKDFDYRAIIGIIKNHLKERESK